jgi:hypothetical protein
MPILKPAAPGSIAPFPSATVAPAPAPEGVVKSQPPPAAPPKPWVLLTVVVVILAIAGVSGWLLLKNDTAFANFVRRKPVAPAPAAPPVQLAPVEAPPAVVDNRSPELMEKVRLLPITAAAGGGSQRLSVGGKVYEPGNTVVEGLILQSIESEEIVFRDAAGNLYTRRL